jgi:hypothetical protein
MQYQYSLSELKPFNIREIENTTHVVYDLPAPILWNIKRYIGEDYWQEARHPVSRVRIYLTTDEFTNEPYAGAVPYDETGQEHPISTARFQGACSITAVLSRMGFELVLSRN